MVSPLCVLSQPLLFIFKPLKLVSLSLFVIDFATFKFDVSRKMARVIARAGSRVTTTGIFERVKPRHVTRVSVTMDG